MSSPVVRAHALATLVLLAGLVGCGDGAEQEPTPPPPAASSAHAPALLTAPREPGEFVFDGEASPAAHGPIALHGRYKVRFAQYAPEDPQLNFTTQTAFVAELRPGASPRSRSIALFRSAAASGSRVLQLDGRYRVEVVFGDFPYAIRFTPAGG